MKFPRFFTTFIFIRINFAIWFLNQMSVSFIFESTSDAKPWNVCFPNRSPRKKRNRKRWAFCWVADTTKCFYLFFFLLFNLCFVVLILPNWQHILCRIQKFIFEVVCLLIRFLNKQFFCLTQILLENFNFKQIIYENLRVFIKIPLHSFQNYY